MATFSKTAAATLLALQQIAASSVVAGAAADVSGKMGGLVYARFGRRSVTASTAGMNLRLECSFSAAGDNSWFPFAQIATAFAACATQSMSVGEAAGTNVIRVASTTNFAAGALVFIDDGANSEWVRVKSIVTNTSITVEDNLVNAHAAAVAMYTAAEIYPAMAIPEGAMRVRAVADGSLYTQAFAVEVRYTTIDGLV